MSRGGFFAAFLLLFFFFSSSCSSSIKGGVFNFAVEDVGGLRSVEILNKNYLQFYLIVALNTHTHRAICCVNVIIFVVDVKKLFNC